MESNRAVTRFMVVLYGLLGLACVALSIGTRSLSPLLAWLVFPLLALLVVVVEAALAWPLMLLTAFLTGRRVPRRPDRKKRPRPDPRPADRAVDLMRRR